jgi:hypothetical protein
MKQQLSSNNQEDGGSLNEGESSFMVEEGSL